MEHHEDPLPEVELKHSLGIPHLVALAVGGCIASGFLLFIGQGIAIAGPAVLISFVLGGVILIAVIACLTEMVIARPRASFASYADEAMGPLAGFLTGWNYWLAWVMGVATESVAAGTYLHVLASGIPVWLTAFVVIAFEMLINIIGVLLMGNYEVVLTTIKTLGLLAFIVVGIIAILGLGVPDRSFTQLTSDGGFFPKGVGAIFAALLTVLFAYVGIELVSVAAEESRDPARDVPRAAFLSSFAAIGIFLVSGVALLVLLPWGKAGTSGSPFVDALNGLGLGTLAEILGWIVIIASISSVDGGLYTASRMLYGMSREGHFPAALAKTHPTRRTPTLATIVTSACAFIGALLAYFFPDTAYIFVASLASFGFLFAWLMISLSQPILRHRRERSAAAPLSWQTPLYPLTPIFAAGMVLTALVGQFFTGGSGTKFGPFTIPGFGIAVVVGLIWTAVWTLYYLLFARRYFTHGAEWREQEAERDAQEAAVRRDAVR